MCECIKKLDRAGYVHRNMMKRGQYFLYQINQFKKVTNEPPVLIKHCPECGGRLDA